MDAIEKLIQEVSFPRPGEYFSPVCTFMKDRSYKDEVFLCVASDAYRVVAKSVMPSWRGDNPLVLTRDDWRFDDVSSLLPALGIGTAEVIQMPVSVVTTDSN